MLSLLRFSNTNIPWYKRRKWGVFLHSAAAINNGDNAWLLISSTLVLMMTAPGLILFYGGLVRGKNVLATMMHSLILMGVVSLVSMVYGYSMAFGEGNAFFGNPHFGLAVIGTFILLKLVDAIVGLRVAEEQETLGLDLSQHGEKAV